jgi:hypothetical protein
VQKAPEYDVDSKGIAPYSTHLHWNRDVQVDHLQARVGTQSEAVLSVDNGTTILITRLAVRPTEVVKSVSRFEGRVIVPL